MAGFGESLGWASNPWYKAFDDNRSALISGFAGLGAARPGNIGGGFAQGFAQGMPLDEQRAERAAEEAKLGEQANATKSWLEQHGFTDLVPLVDAGQADVAFNMASERLKPPAAPDPFTLGAGDIRYDGYGNPIASGMGQSPQTVINNSMGGTDEFYGAFDKALAGQQVEILGQGNTAASNQIRLTELEKLLQTAPTGAQGLMVQAAGSLGLPVEGLDDVQAAQALINQMVPGQRPAGSGTMSDADLALFKASLPSIVNQPGGNARIISTIKAINEYDMAQAEIARQIANREITPAEGRRLQAQVPNPLSGGAISGATTMPNGVTIRRVQ